MAATDGAMQARRVAEPAVSAAAPGGDVAPPRLPYRVRRARDRVADGAAKPRPQSSTSWTNWYSYWS
jgi:hypothetical protein